MRDAMVHRFKLHYLKIISRDWNMKKVANFHFKTLFFMNQKEKPKRLYINTPKFC